MTCNLDYPQSSPRWQGPQRRIGLTGGIASGKSSIGKFLKDVKKLPVLDADIYAHESLAPGKESTRKVINRYGNQILITDKSDKPKIDRKKLANIIFNNKVEREWLEEIIHPVVINRLHKELKINKDKQVIVLIIPLLFEANLTGLCSEIWIANCKLEQQIDRLRIRDHLTHEEAVKRINSQWPIKTKLKRADAVIDNSGTIDCWKNEVEYQLQGLSF